MHACIYRNNFKNFDAEYFCDVEYQIFHLNSNKKKRFLWCQIPIFFYFYFFFANLKKKKDFCDVQYQILGEIPTVWYAMKNLKTHVHFVLKLMQRVLPTGKKKREREGEKRLYICLQLLKDKKTPNSYQGFLTTCQSYLNHVNDPESLTRSGGIPKSQDQSTQNSNISPPWLILHRLQMARRQWQRKNKSKEK